MQITSQRPLNRPNFKAGVGSSPAVESNQIEDTFQCSGSASATQSSSWGKKALMATTLALALGVSGCATYGGGYGYYGNNTAQVLGGALVGAVVGGAIAHELSQPAYVPPYYAPYYNNYNNCMGCYY